MGQIARRCVTDSHAKTHPVNGQYRPSPIGQGGKMDDTSCVVAQVVEWTRCISDKIAMATEASSVALSVKSQGVKLIMNSNLKPENNRKY